MSSISDRVLRLREEKKFSRKYLAELAEVSQPTIYNIENGKTENITLSVGKKIAKALGISFGELFEIETFVSDSNDFKMQLDQLREKVKELEKQLGKELELNILLKNENKRLYTEVVERTLSSVFDFFNELYIYIEDSNNEEENEKRRSILKSELKSVEKYLNGVIEQGIISKSELLEIIYKYDPRIFNIENSSSNFSEDLKNYLKQFIEINDEDIERLLVLYNSRMLRKKNLKRF